MGELTVATSSGLLTVRRTYGIVKSNTSAILDKQNLRHASDITVAHYCYGARSVSDDLIGKVSKATAKQYQIF
jgi:hypothetical protein